MPSRDDDDDEERADLAARVKQLQRDSDEGKQQWWSFCDAEGYSNRRDPNRHTAEFLRRFFDARRDGRIPAGRSAAAPPHEVDPEMHKSLVTRVKQVQRSSPEQKEQWERYCDLHGGGVRDPQRHDSTYLRRFFDEVLTGEPLPVANGSAICGAGACGGYPPHPIGGFPPMGGFPMNGYPSYPPMGYPSMGGMEGYAPMGGYPPVPGYPWAMGGGTGAYVAQAASGTGYGGFSGGAPDRDRRRKKSASRSRSRRRRKAARSPSIDSL